MKQLVNARVDIETYLLLKAQNVNISSMIRNALRAAVDTEISEEEEELRTMIDKDKELQSEISKRLAENTMKLAIIKEKKQQEYDRMMKELPAHGQSLREAGVLEFDL